MTSWQERYDAALKEMSLADECYRIADHARAHAIARKNDAERKLNAVFQERMDQIEERGISVGGITNGR